MIQRAEVEYRVLAKWIEDHPEIPTSAISRLRSKMLEFVEEFPYKSDAWDEVIAKRGAAWTEVAVDELKELGLHEQYLHDAAPLVDRIMADAHMLAVAAAKVNEAQAVLAEVCTITEFNDYRKLIMELRNGISAGLPL